VSPRTRHALIVAVAAVGIAAVAGIAAIQGWLPDWLSGETPTSVETIAGTAPADSLSPGESVVTPDAASAKSSPFPAPVAPDLPPRKAVPTDEPPVPAPSAAPRPKCPHCGTVSSTTFHEREARNVRWEVRVRFDDGTRKILRYPTDPGFRGRDRVALTQGRVRKE
jgi:hypothetical protein